jgi:hypothetical protein
MIEDGDSLRPPDDAWTHPDGSVMINLRLITEKKTVRKWYTLTCPASRLVYQDTDSNYYRAPAIEEFFSTCQSSVERARKVMHSLLDHNYFYALLVVGLVNRWPIGVSCDGAFISAYWSPMKKQYMGVKSPISHDKIDKIDEDLLFPKLSDRREDEAVSKFLDRKHIKVTGYLIIRRETPDYVINWLFSLLENLLCLREGTNALAVARTIIANCEVMIRQASSADVRMFSSQQKYNPYIKGDSDIKAIVFRLRQEGRHEVIPPEFSVARYVLVADQKLSSDEWNARGKIVTGRKRERKRLLGELEESFRLDVPYYLEKMAKALANLVFEELLTEARDGASEMAVVERIDHLLRQYHDTYADDTKESKKIAKRAMKEASMLLMSRHYTVQGASRSHTRHFRRAGELLGHMTVSTATSQRAVKNALAVCFDKTTPSGRLAEIIISTEIRMALLKRQAVQERAWIYAIFIQSIPTEEERRQYVMRRCEVIGAELTTANRSMIVAYVRLIKAMQIIDPALSRTVLDHRREGTDVTVESLEMAIPAEQRFRLATELVVLNSRVEPFREAIREKKAFERGLEMLAAQGNPSYALQQNGKI